MKKKMDTFGVGFYLRTYKKNLDGTTPIYARITVNGKRVDMAVKRTIDPANWNPGKGMAKGSREELAKLNNYLEELRSLIVECYQELKLQRKTITAQLIKNRITNGYDDEHTLTKMIAHHHKMQKDILAEGTMKNYYTTERYILKFIQVNYNRKDLCLSELDYDFILNFELFLRRIGKKDNLKPLNNNGIMKHIERLRKIVTMAVTLGWLEKDPFVNFKRRLDAVHRQYLTRDELAKIEALELTVDPLIKARDLFVFSCYTGLSYIDVMQLAPAAIEKGLDGRDWIVAYRQKTTTGVKIPLLSKARQVIDRYIGRPDLIADNSLLPKMSNQKVNLYLKEVARLCNIQKPLTFHIARHTFATAITLSNGVSMESVSKMLGHTKLSTTQIYAKVIESKLSEDMMNLEKKLSKV
ncbi:site-specific integrase [uncultured Pedobacter sp.]|uniref:site-specific integrase n=1 Tax=uncultured Pedobacter sp. TaxID=246139 RepID=UPI002631F0FD|nr:site-specific integrase [uncultured Pedobacter sp.]